MPSAEDIKNVLGWIFNNPTAAMAVLFVGWKLSRKADEILARQTTVISGMQHHVGLLNDAIERVEHAAAGVLQTHLLTRAAIRRMRRSLGDHVEDTDEVDV